LYSGEGHEIAQIIRPVYVFYLANFILKRFVSQKSKDKENLKLSSPGNRIEDNKEKSTELDYKEGKDQL
jgi:hypothetical protein